jgi:hypothetical protein
MADPVGHDAAHEHTPGIQDYLQSLHKLIPTEITAAYIAIYSILDPLRQGFGSPNAYALYVAIAVLAILNYYLLKYIRGVERRDVRLYTSLTFIVWVLGTTVDYWSAFTGLNTGIFLVVVILWAVA